MYVHKEMNARCTFMPTAFIRIRYRHGFSDAIDKTFVAIKGEAKKKLRVAIANTKIYEKYFEDVLKDVYDRSLDRYEKLEEILRLAVKEKVDMIVFPECYLPYEWLARLYRFSATNKIAIISGIEIIALNHSDENSFQKDILNLIIIALRIWHFMKRFISRQRNKGW